MITKEFTKKNKYILIIYLIFLFVYNNIAFCQVDKLLSENVYIDPKGFFKIRPPAGWIIKEYSDDPRGKVDFNSSPSQPLAQIKIIGQISKFNSIEEALQAERMGLDRLRARLKQSGLDLQGNTELSNMFNKRVIKGVNNIKGKLNQEIIWLLINNNYYTICYGAPPDLFDKYYSLAMKSINTFDPVGKIGAGKEAEQHTIASIIRRAQLYIQMGQKETAMKILNEGLEIYQGNKELINLKNQIENP